jgi:hypothetical protein
MYILGDSSAAKSAFDTTPSTSSFIAAKIKWTNLRIGGFDRPFSIPQTQLCVFEDLLVDGVSGKCIFYIHPASGTGQSSNSNRVSRCQFTGSNVQMFDYALPTATERMANWAFRDCDIQFSGTAVPITYPDYNFVLENCEFENSTAANLIKLTYSGTASTNYFTYIAGNQLLGGDGVTNAKIRIEGASPAIPCFITLINNNAGSASLKLIDINFDNGWEYPIVLINNRGILGSNTNGRILAMGGDQSAGGGFDIPRISAPGAPPADHGRFYVDTSGGKNRLMIRFPTGAAQQIAVEP